ncbi:MAG: glutathione S-transferase family protein [Trueperaceae bacterium]|nr:glutathione S-transferase family protein [Trueperaceae bacterium]
MRPTLFSSRRSPHCFKVSIALHEKGVRFDRVEIDLRTREQKTAAYLALNPRGKVPAYFDEDGAHLDSLDILLHLEVAHPEPRSFPADERARRDVLTWIDWSSGPLRDVSHHLYWQLIEPPEAGIDHVRAETLLAEGRRHLHAVEEALERSGGRWIVAAPDLPGPSAADVCVYAWLSGYRRFGLPDTDLPRLGSWLASLDTRPAVMVSRDTVGVPFAQWRSTAPRASDLESLDDER